MLAARPGRACSFMAATIKSSACSRTSSIVCSGIELLHAAESGLDSSAPAREDGLPLEEPGDRDRRYERGQALAEQELPGSDRGREEWLECAARLLADDAVGGEHVRHDQGQQQEEDRELLADQRLAVLERRQPDQRRVPQ